MAIFSDTWPDLAETHQAQLHPCASGHMDASPQSTKPGTPGTGSYTEDASLSLGMATHDYKPLSRRRLQGGIRKDRGATPHDRALTEG